MDHLKENPPVNNETVEDETMEQVAGGALDFFRCDICKQNWTRTHMVHYRGQTMCYACKLRLSQQNGAQFAEKQGG